MPAQLIFSVSEYVLYSNRMGKAAYQWKAI